MGPVKGQGINDFFFKFQIKSKTTEDETQPQRDAIEEKRAEDGSAEVDNEDNKYREKKGTEKLSNWLAVVVLLFCFGIFGLVLLMDNRLPKPLTLAGNFICQVCLDFLKDSNTNITC